MSDPVQNLTTELGDFKLKMSDALGILTTNVGILSAQVKLMAENLSKQNGHVEDLSHRMIEAEKHPFVCAMKGKVAELEESFTIHVNASEKARTCADQWKLNFWIPIARWAAIGIIMMLVFLLGTHASVLLEG